MYTYNIRILCIVHALPRTVQSSAELTAQYVEGHVKGVRFLFWFYGLGRSIALKSCTIRKAQGQLLEKVGG